MELLSTTPEVPCRVSRPQTSANTCVHFQINLTLAAQSALPSPLPRPLPNTLLSTRGTFARTVPQYSTHYSNILATPLEQEEEESGSLPLLGITLAKSLSAVAEKASRAASHTIASGTSVVAVEAVIVVVVVVVIVVDDHVHFGFPLMFVVHFAVGAPAEQPEGGDDQKTSDDGRHGERNTRQEPVDDGDDEYRETAGGERLVC